MLGQYLRDVEAGRLAGDEQLAIDDSVRNFGSPVFLNLAGTTEARVVLEAMIAHSDNIATDRATLKVGADRVRALIAQAGLRFIRIPDTTSFFEILSSSALRRAWTWVGRGSCKPPRTRPGEPRPPLNDVVTLAGSAHQFVLLVAGQTLAGAFFTRPETLIEFKRIQAMSEQIVKAVPQDTPAYAKGGEVVSSPRVQRQELRGADRGRGGEAVTR